MSKVLKKLNSNMEKIKSIVISKPLKSVRKLYFSEQAHYRLCEIEIPASQAALSAWGSEVLPCGMVEHFHVNSYRFISVDT